MTIYFAFVTRFITPKQKSFKFLPQTTFPWTFTFDSKIFTYSVRFKKGEIEGPEKNQTQL